MVAISQAPSPESNPNPPLPVRGKVVHYTTFNLIGGEFIQQRIAGRDPATLPLHWPESTSQPLNQLARGLDGARVERRSSILGQLHPVRDRSETAIRATRVAAARAR